jgi:hypothetical protein
MMYGSANREIAGNCVFLYILSGSDAKLFLLKAGGVKLQFPSLFSPNKNNDAQHKIAFKHL